MLGRGTTGMRKLLVLALFGMAAQLVDGGLGMAYGLTSSTLLLAFGLAPAVASASVHLAEVGTTLASGLAHHKLGNTDWRTVRWLAVPGAIGAFSGAVLLSNLHADAARPFIALFLSVLGLYLLVRFAFLGGAIKLREGSVSTKLLAPLGMIAGFLDAVGGGGWGPVTTSTLVASERIEPRRVIGSVDTAEFVVALAASAGSSSDWEVRRSTGRGYSPCWPAESSRLRSPPGSSARSPPGARHGRRRHSRAHQCPHDRERAWSAHRRGDAGRLREPRREHPPHCRASRRPPRPRGSWSR